MLIKCLIKVKQMVYWIFANYSFKENIHSSEKWIIAQGYSFFPQPKQSGAAVSLLVLTWVLFFSSLWTPVYATLKTTWHLVICWWSVFGQFCFISFLSSVYCFFNSLASDWLIVTSYHLVFVLLFVEHCFLLDYLFAFPLSVNLTAIQPRPSHA